MFKTIKWNTGSAAERFRLKNKKNKKKNKAASSQAGGPAPKESGFKRHQKNTKEFKTLQDAINYNAKERS